MTATHARLGAMSLLAVLLLTPSARADTPAKSDAQFFMLLAHKPAATLNDGYQAVAMLVRGDGKLLPPEACRTLLVQRKVARASWGSDPKAALSKGKLAYMVCQALGIKGGVTMRLFGPSERYCLFECLHLDLMVGGATYQSCTGGELVGVVNRADEYQQEHKTTPPPKAVAETKSSAAPKTPAVKAAPKPAAKSAPAAKATATGDSDVIEIKPEAVEPKTKAAGQVAK
jgi:hypothetical protein